MKTPLIFRFVPKPLRLIRCERPARATKPKPSGGEVRYVPAWIGSQLMPFPVVMKSRAKPSADFYDDP